MLAHTIATAHIGRTRVHVIGARFTRPGIGEALVVQGGVAYLTIVGRVLVAHLVRDAVHYAEGCTLVGAEARPIADVHGIGESVVGTSCSLDKVAPCGGINLGQAGLTLVLRIQGACIEALSAYGARSISEVLAKTAAIACVQRTRVPVVGTGQTSPSHGPALKVNQRHADLAAVLRVGLTGIDTFAVNEARPEHFVKANALFADVGAAPESVVGAR